MKQLCTGFDPAIGVSRREALSRLGLGLGGIALGNLLGSAANAAVGEAGDLGGTHFAPKAKRVILLFQSGAPSQLDLFDYKPLLNERHGQQLPDSVRQGQRLTGMSGNQSSLPMVGSPYKFQRHGQSGAWISELLPHTAKIADHMCIVRSMYTEAINHGPAVTFFQTGSQLAGRPTIGSWLNYGLGDSSENLPSYVVLLTKGKSGQPLLSRYWGSGFLASKHQGIRFRASKDPVLYLTNPEGIDAESRKKMLAQLRQLQEQQFERIADPEIESRIAQYEMAYRMQTSVPEVSDLSQESDSTFEEYGPDSKEPGTYAANCLLARRLVEKGVRFVQLYHQGWDQHDNLPKKLSTQCRETDQATAALVRDLDRRGLLDDTLVVWGGEFGRTNYCQGKLTNNNFGRDHHPRCFTIWMAGGGVKPGLTYGESDPFGYNLAADGVHVHDFQATLLHLLGIDHLRLTYKHQGRRYRLTDVHGKVVEPLLA
jgi:hypothetical protein